VRVSFFFLPAAFPLWLIGRVHLLFRTAFWIPGFCRKWASFIDGRLHFLFLLHRKLSFGLVLSIEFVFFPLRIDSPIAFLEILGSRAGEDRGY